MAPSKQPEVGKSRKRLLLIWLCAASAVLMVVEIGFARRIHSATSLTIWELELLVLPWVLFVGTYLGLVSTSWFDSDPGSGNLARRALSLVGAAGVLGLTTMLYFGLVF
jgi:hypothetical protein